MDATHGLVAGGGLANFGQYFGASANGWLFPLQLKYTSGRRTLVPFVAAGATLRHLGAFDGPGIQVLSTLQIPRAAMSRCVDGVSFPRDEISPGSYLGSKIVGFGNPG